jgi:hypothetical protein
MVDGDIWAPPLNPGTGAELSEAEAPPEGANRSAEAWLKPVDCADDELEEVSEWMASSAADAAPKPISMTELRQAPQRAAFPLGAIDQQAPCHREEPHKIRGFCTSTRPAAPAIDAAAAEFSASIVPHCPQAPRVLRGKHP